MLHLLYCTARHWPDGINDATNPNLPLVAHREGVFDHRRDQLGGHQYASFAFKLGLPLQTMQRIIIQRFPQRVPLGVALRQHYIRQGK